MNGPEDSLLDAFSKEFPELGMVGGMSPFLNDHSPIPPTLQSPPTGTAAMAKPEGNISHFPPSGQTAFVQNLQSGLLPPVLPEIQSQFDTGDSISSLPLSDGNSYPGSPSFQRSPSQASGPLAQLNAIELTGTDHFQGRMVELYMGAIEAQVVVATATLTENDGPQGKFGRFKGAQSRLKQLHQLAQLELRNEAMKLGANAILRAASQRTSFDGFLIITVSGTAVRLSPN
jgi:uncharacterized protein YbjQ (UPF0145 family)